jgi:hypothetical protein
MARSVRSGAMRALIGAVVLAGLVGSAPACDDDEIEFVSTDGLALRTVRAIWR